ncbi:homeobox-leucine zipper protein ROC1-like isoform X1 [Sesamum indicum]|uniref:Homeobox-leucine zipper protein ROC1-like isoform X1 n=1 Tax=Sesamum indicum TaxID=4182 RepID=A0A8M8UYV0_SESIN|nr:homeobox-leucine zipper protein ROC1-like isoform X1 [Sesamum indicum]
MMNSNMSEEDDVRRTRGEEINSDSSNSNSIEDQRPKRKRYHRHTPRQIQEMEAFFKECPHPDDRQRKELSSELGMQPLQVKFWFQNKRTQMKTQHEHQENTQLRSENEKLRAENMRYREALSNASCPTCGGPTPMAEASFHQHQLRMENARLREEIDHISAVATNYVGRPFANPTEAPSASTLASFKRTCRATDLGRPAMDNAGQDVDRYRLMAIEVAVAATEEVIRIAQVGDPLWVPSMDRNATLLNEEEYLRSFSRVFDLKLDGFKCEASRESVVVAMSAPKVIEILMDVEKWSNVFSGVVSRAKHMQLISSGVGENYNEALQVMNAEFHVPSPLVPTRESYFLRFCKQHLTDDTWTVVDVSLDGLHSATPQLVACRRRPSGCVIQDMPNGYSKVTWMEHVEVEDGGVHNIYKPLITAGLAFGAKRWVAILDAHSQRLQRAAAPKADVTCLGDDTTQGWKSILKLGERMVTRFCSGVNASTGNSWTTLSGNGSENVRVMTRNNMDDLSMPVGLHLTIATSFWLPIPPKKVFDFLRDPHTRNKWDMLSNGGDVEEMMQIVSGKEIGNSVAIYQAKSATSRQTTLLESRTDPTASYVVYAPIDMVCLNAILGGGDPSSIPLLPSGFAILPDGPTGSQGRGMAAEADSGGSLLTVALQVLVDPSPNAKVSLGSITVANNLISCTVDKIKNALIPKSS